MLEETNLRREDFLPGTPVRLADGGEWTLPHPPFEGGHGPGDLGDDYRALVTAIAEAADEPERRRAGLALVIALLARNYRLGPAQFQALLDAPGGTPAGARLAEALEAVGSAHVERMRPSSSSDVPPAGRGEAGLGSPAYSGSR